MDLSTAGKRLAHARRIRDLTQDEVADRAEIGRRTLVRYEKDDNLPRDAATWNRLSYALGVEPAWLISGTGPMEKSLADVVAEQPPDAQEPKNMMAIPILSVEASAGQGAVVAYEETVEDVFSINRRVLSIQWSDEDEHFIATSAEFPGLIAVGKTPVAAAENAVAVLESQIEGYREFDMPLPEPWKFVEASGQTRLRLPKSLHGRPPFVRSAMDALLIRS